MGVRIRAFRSKTCAACKRRYKKAMRPRGPHVSTSTPNRGTRSMPITAPATMRLMRATPGPRRLSGSIACSTERATELALHALQRLQRVNAGLDRWVAGEQGADCLAARDARRFKVLGQGAGLQATQACQRIDHGRA